jgi:cytochrome c556
MKHLGTIMIAAMAGAFAIATLTPSGFAQDIAAAVKARQELMKSNGASAGKIAKSDNAKEIAEAAKTIEDNAKKLATLWPANSTAPNSRAKAEIWQNKADFDSKLKSMETNAGNVVRAAEKGDVAAAKEAQKGVTAVCGSCHQAYRGPEIAKK